MSPSSYWTGKIAVVRDDLAVKPLAAKCGAERRGAVQTAYALSDGERFDSVVAGVNWSYSGGRGTSEERGPEERSDHRCDLRERRRVHDDVAFTSQRGRGFHSVQQNFARKQSRANMPTEAELDDLVLSRHRTTLKLAWEAELREDLEDGGDDDAAYRVASMSEADRAEATSTLRFERSLDGDERRAYERLGEASRPAFVAKTRHRRSLTPVVRAAFERLGAAEQRERGATAQFIATLPADEQAAVRARADARRSGACSSAFADGSRPPTSRGGRRCRRQRKSDGRSTRTAIAAAGGTRRVGRASAAEQEAAVARAAWSPLRRRRTVRGSGAGGCDVVVSVCAATR